MRLSLAAAIVVACSCVGTIQASVVFTLGDNPQPGEENVVLNNGTTGNTVFGTTNLSSVSVAFTSTQTLSEPSSGTGRIEATDGTNQIALTDITISLPSYSYGDLILNAELDGTVGTTGGTANLVVTDSTGSTFPFSTTLGLGSNFFTITTTGGERLVSTTIQYSSGFSDLRQIRVSGVAALPTPEPAPLPVLAALGGLLLGVEFFREKRRREHGFGVLVEDARTVRRDR